jgi:hypothetical protein
MVAPNRIDFIESEDQWYCYPCKRFFVSEKAIHAHCSNAAVHSREWCDRCEWLFVSQGARMDHHRHSSHHNVCPNCQVDFDSLTHLDDHMEKRYFYCKRCRNYVKDSQGRKSQALWHAHQIRTHFMCAKCDTYFENQNNVDQVWTRSKSPLQLATNHIPASTSPSPTRQRMLWLLPELSNPLRHDDSLGVWKLFLAGHN